MTTYREQLLKLAEELSITDDEAGEPQWAAYLTDDQLAEAIIRLRSEQTKNLQQQLQEQAHIEEWDYYNGSFNSGEPI